MGDEVERRTAQQVSADQMEQILLATAAQLAHTRPVQQSTAPSQERVQVIKLLVKLAEHLPEFCRRAVLGDATVEDWNQVANTLRAASRAVDHEVTQRHHVVVDAKED